MSDFNLETFQTRLRDTILWCSAHFVADNLTFSLRTDPQPPCTPLKDCLPEFMQQVIEKQTAFNELPDLFLTGRLLILYPDLCACGTPEIPDLQGYMDTCNLPPWDTWVYYGVEEIDGAAIPYLLCWMPFEVVKILTPHLKEFAGADWLEACRYPFSFLPLLDWKGYLGAVRLSADSQGLHLEPSFVPELFLPRLRSTIAWCAGRFTMENVEYCLRTPPYPLSYLEGKAAYPDRAANILESEMLGFAQTVFEKRKGSRFSGNLKGKLLISMLSWTTCDGIAPITTLNFIDVCDVPAWDCWVDYVTVSNTGYLMEYMISWIPEPLIPYVDVAVQQSALESLYWVSQNLSFDNCSQAIMRHGWGGLIGWEDVAEQG